MDTQLFLQQAHELVKDEKNVVAIWQIFLHF